MQLGVLRHARLDEQRRLRRIDAGGQPVDHHVPYVLPDDLRIFVVRGQRMPVGDEKQALVLVLQLDPVLQHAVIVAEMQRAGRAHAGQDAIREHGRNLQSNPSRAKISVAANIHNGPDDCAQHMRRQQHDDDDEAIGLNHSKPVGQPVRQQADRDAPAVERRNRNQIQHHQPEIDDDAALGHPAQRIGEVIHRQQATRSSAPAPTTSAMSRFAPGPAAATHSMSRLGLRRLPKLTGTGLAHPNTN